MLKVNHRTFGDNRKPTDEVINFLGSREKYKELLKEAWKEIMSEKQDKIFFRA